MNKLTFFRPNIVVNGEVQPTLLLLPSLSLSVGGGATALVAPPNLSDRLPTHKDLNQRPLLVPSPFSIEEPSNSGATGGLEIAIDSDVILGTTCDANCPLS